MDNIRVNLNLFSVFEVLMRERNVTRAAARLGLSQPAVSAALARLREITGDPLLIRTGHGMRPTMRAQELIVPVNQALMTLRSALQPDHSMDPATSSRVFTIMLSDIGELVYLPRLIERVKAEAPNIRLDVRRLIRSAVADELAFGGVDMAIGYVEKPPRALRRAMLFDESFVCMLRKQHPRIRDELTLEDYLAEAHLLVARQSSLDARTLHTLDGAVASELDRMGVSRNVAMSVPHFLALPVIVANTDLLVSIPRRLGEVYHEPGYNRLLPLPFATRSFRVSLFWHPRSQDDSGNAWLREIILDLFREDKEPPRKPARHPAPRPPAVADGG